MPRQRGCSVAVLAVFTMLCTIGCADENRISRPSDVTPPGPVTDLAATSIRDSTVTLTWTAPGDDEYEGTCAQYEIRYQDSAQPEPWWENAIPLWEPPVPKDAGRPDCACASGLVPGKRYYFCLRAADEASNWSLISNMADAIVMPVDFSGTWRGLVDDWYLTDEDAGIVLTLDHIGSEVTGTYELDGIAGTLHSGVFDGDAITLITRFESQDLEFIFSARPNGDLMKGLWGARMLSTGELLRFAHWHAERENTHDSDDVSS